MPRYVGLPQPQWLEAANTPAIFVDYVRSFVMPVARNAVNTKQTTARSALKLVVIAQRLAEQWPRKLLTSLTMSWL
ncbi:hypothetical protein WG68_04170 [Arsukibacterium ikkense]|uniref:Uncharacterized protein n=1 Tax=Arsukibacterium ikkense TaxID=336831 RepID=A0A0M2V7B3_9GAMM|nr:hypothetical protein WG68_04170 [Arsukibacterium ikkense]